MTITLPLSFFDKSIFWHGAETYIILGLICVLLGIFVGWLAWRKCKEQADELERANRNLKQLNKQLEEKQGAIHLMVEEL